jgi:hypothetical protein
MLVLFKKTSIGQRNDDKLTRQFLINPLMALSYNSGKGRRAQKAIV